MEKKQRQIAYENWSVLDDHGHFLLSFDTEEEADDFIAEQATERRKREAREARLAPLVKVTEKFLDNYLNNAVDYLNNAIDKQDSYIEFTIVNNQGTTHSVTLVLTHTYMHPYSTIITCATATHIVVFGVTNNSNIKLSIIHDSSLRRLY